MGKEATTPFNAIKDTLANATLLTHPKPFAQMCIMSHIYIRHGGWAALQERSREYGTYINQILLK